MSVVENLNKLLQQGQDNALLRYSLGNEYLKLDDFSSAEQHLRKCLDYQSDYSAAWKILGKAVAAQAKHQQAIEVFEQGIAVAEQKGDIQAAKEMRVFQKRSRKHLESPA